MNFITNENFDYYSVIDFIIPGKKKRIPKFYRYPRGTF